MSTRDVMLRRRRPKSDSDSKDQFVQFIAAAKAPRVDETGMGFARAN